MYKEPKQKFGNLTPQPKPNFVHIFKDKSNKQYDSAVKPAAKPSKVTGSTVASRNLSMEFEMTANEAFDAAAALVEEETGRYDIARKIRALKGEDEE